MAQEKSHKLGLWRVTALVIGSQVGVGVFMLPATLAPFGIYALYGWAASAFGAILLAIVFGKLCRNIPKAGGPHVYVLKSIW
ncbi:MAG UNVERIFIED_CONTAM: amino acid permease [Rickettsiaceae bacterium]|jgi:APA family basic amino acid/polyamine antiporter